MALLLLGLTIIVVAAAFLFLPGLAERRINRVTLPPPYRVGPEAGALHRTLIVADLHADSLLWDRDLLKRGTRGHVDVPRLIEGNVAIQAFTVVTRVPNVLTLNERRNEDRLDFVLPLAVFERWPIRSWGSLRERALYQARKLRDTAARSGGRLTLLLNRGDLEEYLRRRMNDPGRTAGFLGLEGLHALEGDADSVDRLYDAGFRMLGLAHFMDNEACGSAHGVKQGGLTEFGREVVRRAESRHMIIDVSHGSPAAVEDVLAMATRPVVASHTGVRGTCDNPRNLSDDQLRGIAGTGGLIGIGYWRAAVCGGDVRAVVKAICHAVGVAGVEHVALGSDFDGAVTLPFDASGVSLVTEALLAEGLREADIRRIMGENVRDLLLAALPRRD